MARLMRQVFAVIASALVATSALADSFAGVCSITGGGGSSAFSAITSGTNTTGAMVVGTGASLGVSGTGTIAATSAPASGLTGTTIASGVVASSLTSVGTLTTGVWNATAIDATHGGTAQSTWTTGDILYSSATNTLSKLSGNTVAAKRFLTQTGTGSVSAAPTWAAILAADVPTLNQNTTGSAASFTGSLAGDVTGTQSATTVARINGTSLAGLATGILKNTTTTGVPSIAVVNTDYQSPISLTTTGTSGAATFVSNVLNVPNYALGGGSAFSAITSGTNTTAAMVVGTGSSLTTSGTGSISQPNIVGVTTNSNAAAGSVGELIDVTVPFSTPVSLVSATAKTIATITLPAGDYDVWAMAGFLPAGTTSISVLTGAVSQTTNTLPTSPNGGAYFNDSGPAFVTGGLSIQKPVGMTRISLATSGSVFLVVSSSFTVSTMTAFGYLGARRIR